MIAKLIFLVYLFLDAGGGKKFGSGRKNGTSQPAEKGVGPTLPTSLEAKHKETTPAAR